MRADIIRRIFSCNAYQGKNSEHKKHKSNTDSGCEFRAQKRQGMFLFFLHVRCKDTTLKTACQVFIIILTQQAAVNSLGSGEERDSKIKHRVFSGKFIRR